MKLSTRKSVSILAGVSAGIAALGCTLCVMSHLAVEVKNGQMLELMEQLEIATGRAEFAEEEYASIKALYDDVEPFDMATKAEMAAYQQRIEELEKQIGGMSFAERAANTQTFLPGYYQGVSQSYDYYLYDPGIREDNKQMPLIVSLHDGGGTGTNLNKLVNTDVGLCSYIAEGLVHPNAIVLMPQSPNGWASGYEDLMDLINKTVHDYDIDPNRVYITGPSRGGIGTFEMLIRYPDYFAAAMPLCAAIAPNRCTEIKIPGRIDHGTLDTGMGFSVKDADKIMNENGGNSELIMLEGQGHNIQFIYYQDEYGALDWLLSQ